MCTKNLQLLFFRLCVLLMTLLSLPAQAQFTYDGKIGTGGSANGQFNSPYGVAVGLNTSSLSSNVLTKIAIINPDIRDKEIIKKSLDGFLIYEPEINDNYGVIISNINSMILGKKIDELVIFSHGENNGKFFIGNLEVSKESLRQQHSFSYFFNFLASDANVYVYSCLSGEGEAGRQLLDAVKQKTSANIFLSENVTGKNGDWILEVSNSNKKASPTLNIEYLMANYQYDLQTISEAGFTLHTVASMPTSMAGMAIDEMAGSIYLASANTASALYRITPTGTVTLLNTNWSSSNTISGLFYPYIATDVEFYNGFFYSQLYPNTLRVVNASTGIVSATLSGVLSNYETGAAVIGNYLYTTNGQGGGNVFFKRDLTTNLVSTLSIALPNASYETLEASSNPNELIYNGNGQFRRINLLTNTISPVIATVVGNSYSHFALTKDGNFAFYYEGSTIFRVNLTTGVISNFIINIPNVSGLHDLEFGPSRNGIGYSLYFTNNSTLFEVRGFDAPCTKEINVQGNSVSIVDGHATPTLADHSDFGNVNIGSNLERTFTIENTGCGALTISSIVSSSAKFVVSNAPTSVVANSSATFKVTYTPTGIGTDNATITINSDDADEGVYDFAVRGRGARNALSFDGVDDYVSISSMANIPIGNSAYTIEAWVKPNSVGAMGIVGWGNYGSTKQVNAFRLATAFEGSGLKNYWWGDDFTVTLSAIRIALGNPSFTFADGNWNHVAVTYNGSNRVMYVNGVQVGLLASSGNNAQAVNFRIGHTSILDVMNPEYFNGGIDELRIWNTARTVGDISGSMNTELTGSESGLVSYFKFNQGIAGGTNTGLTTAINGASCNNGTLTNFALTGTTSNWVVGQPLTEVADLVKAEINVQGNSQNIVDGDVTPVLTDHTDFGNVTLSGNLERTFTIQNTGCGALTISSIVSSSAKFVVSNAPTSISANSSATFKVTYTPTTAVVDNATITINNNDADEGVYDFAVRGTGVCSTITFQTAPVAPLCPGGQNGSITFSNANGGASPYSYSIDNGQNYQSGASFTGLIAGTYFVKVKDNNGCEGTAQVSVPVGTDTENPTISCPANITVSNDNGKCGAVVQFSEPTFADNCSGASIKQTAGLASGSEFPVGTTTNTFEVTDASGNTAECSFTVTVNDTEKPTISCPINITVSNDNGKCGAVVDYKVDFGDNCKATISQTAGLASGSEFPIGTTTNTFVVTDASGNTATCSFTVTVNDTEKPTISCPANVIVNNDAGKCSKLFTYNTPTFADNCAGASIKQIAGLVSGSEFPVGTNTVTFEATDASGNKTTCSFTVTVNDTEKPTISCPANITVNNDKVLGVPICGAKVNYNLPTFSDNCPGATIKRTSGLLTASGSIFPVGTTTVTFEATDASGNKATCSFTVTVKDVDKPTISCPKNITKNNDAGVCGAVVNYQTPLSLDQCLTGVTVVRTNGLASGSVFPVGTTTVTYEATDAAGNKATCSFTVTVKDTEKPKITCPPSLSVNADAGKTFASSVALGSPTTSDNCAVNPATNNAPTTFPLGTTTVTWTVTDVNGNSATCEQIVTVTDKEAPVVTCPANVTVNADAGKCSTDKANVDLGTPTASDNDGIASVTNNAPATFPVGTTDVIWTVTDKAGNTATCTQKVTVIDNENPTIVCKADVMTSAAKGQCATTLSLLQPYTSDNCGVKSVTNNAPSSFPVGITDVIWTVTDVNGNTAQCSQKVTVTDDEKPTISCPVNITVSNENGKCGAVVKFDAPTFADNCSGATIKQTSGLASGSEFPVGTTTNTFEVTDASGNTAECSFTVTVNDTEKPTISCPINITVSNDNGKCGAVVEYKVDFGDNCKATISQTAGLASGSEFPVGTTTNTFVVTDAAGNKATCSFTVTVKDTEKPKITCPPSLSINADAGKTFASSVALGSLTTSDNCAVNPATNNAPTTFPLGTTTVTWTVTDVNGNSATCEQTVTVTDKEAPFVTCPANVNVFADQGKCSIARANVNLGNPTASDNDGIASVTNNAPATFPVGTTTVTWTVTDKAGNKTTCDQSVTVTDNEKPILAGVPSDVSVTCGQVPIPPTVTANDNCDGALTVSYNQTQDGNVITRTWTATDKAGNTATGVQKITLTPDTTKPELVGVPSNVTVACDKVPTAPTVTATDNCGAEVTYKEVRENGNCAGNYVLKRTWTATDKAGNTVSATQTITVEDKTPPTITCLADINILIEANATGGNATFAATANDACGAVVLSYSPASGSLFAVGSTTVTATATDACGNKKTCTFKVIVTKKVSACVADCDKPKYASSVVSYNPGKRKNGLNLPAERVIASNALGAPQNNDTNNFVSLGFGGRITLQLGSPVLDHNTKGGDLFVVETSFGRAGQVCIVSNGNTYPETANVEGSEDGVNFVFLGSLCRTGAVDVKPAIEKGMNCVKFIRITDTSNPMLFTMFYGNDDGFDVDGILVCPKQVMNAINALACSQNEKSCVKNDNKRTENEEDYEFDAAFNNLAPNAVEQVEMSIFPNPANSEVNLDIIADESVQQVNIIMYNALGVVVETTQFSTKYGFNRNKLQVNHLSSGIYFIKAVSQDGRFTQTFKLVKE